MSGTLHLPDGAQPEQPQRPVAGVMIAGYGCFVNAQMIAKIDVAEQGRDWFVVAYLNSPNDTLGGHLAYLSPPLRSQAEAATMAETLAQNVYIVFSSVEGGGAHWPDEVSVLRSSSGPAVN
jgi:hypothetical protein